MEKDMGASGLEPDRAAGLRPQPLAASSQSSIPSAWHFTEGTVPKLQECELILALGLYGDIYGPLPFEMFNPEAWVGGALHASHDLVAYAFCDLSWHDAFGYDAQAIEARRAETQSDSVHESAVAESHAP